MKILKKLRSSMTANIIGLFIASLAVFGIIIGVISRVSVESLMKEEYNFTAFHIADTAEELINTDHLDAYLDGEEQEEYLETKNKLDVFCRKMNVSLIYLIKVDTSDYGRFVCIFDAVCNEVDNTKYEAWELGHKRDTTNDEYREKYRLLYNGSSDYETVYRYKESPVDGINRHFTLLAPVENSEGEVVAIMCVQRPIRELEKAMMPYLVTGNVSMAVLTVIFILFLSYFIRKRLIVPVSKVSKEAFRFARTKSKGKPLANISSYTELANLAESVDSMEKDMVAYMENLAAATAEKERISAELSFARTIQRDSVPNDFPAFPERSDFTIYASMTPAKAVGGDFYNFFLIDDDHLAIAIGDVSGKGVPAALFMMATNIIMSSRTKVGGTPAEIIRYVNDDICEHNRADMFVTLWLGILELSTGSLTLANAGHEDPAVCRKDGSFELMKTRHGLVAGAMPGVRYRDFVIQLEKGDKLFVYTDGVPEATDGANNMFTLDRMLQALNNVKTGSPEEILDGVAREVEAFVGEAPQFDDLTMLCLEYKGR